MYVGIYRNKQPCYLSIYLQQNAAIDVVNLSQKHNFKIYLPHYLSILVVDKDFIINQQLQPSTDKCGLH